MQWSCAALPAALSVLSTEPVWAVPGIGSPQLGCREGRGELKNVETLVGEGG
jgi:hypothetical protein